MAKEKKKESDFSLEKTLGEIRAIVEKMQQGAVDFDEQIALFKKGQDLIKESQQFLNEAELEIKQLVDGELEDFD
ncbi:MAG: exodeoxyribonuclease VII small subunit [Bacteroidia bacterium]